MRKSLLPAIALVAFGAVGAAFAEDATGKIAAIDAATWTVTLADGSVYEFDNTKTDATVFGQFRVGDSVHIVWAPMGEKRMAESMQPAS
jgi:hypothetical protein